MCYAPPIPSISRGRAYPHLLTRVRCLLCTYLRSLVHFVFSFSSTSHQFEKTKILLMKSLLPVLFLVGSNTILHFPVEKGYLCIHNKFVYIFN